MSDLDIIQQIEQELGVKLEPVEKLQWQSKGYVLDKDQQVTEIGLSPGRDYRAIISSPPIEKEFKHFSF